MKSWTMLCVGVATMAVLAGSAALGQQQPKSADCNARTPEKVEGEVIKVDHSSGKVTIRDKAGSTHEFQATRETLQAMKAGDKVEAKLREAPKC